MKLVPNNLGTGWKVWLLDFRSWCMSSDSRKELEDTACSSSYSCVFSQDVYKKTKQDTLTHFCTRVRWTNLETLLNFLQNTSWRVKLHCVKYCMGIVNILFLNYGDEILEMWNLHFVSLLSVPLRCMPLQRITFQLE